MRAQQEWKRHGQGPWDYSSNAKRCASSGGKASSATRTTKASSHWHARRRRPAHVGGSANITLLEQIVADQRKIIAETNRTPTAVPQDWALYKEVQEYYEKGMRVPDDVTLLWCDDNWGNIRRLPTPEERKRSGGAGIYYHFDYVGDPRSYKWLNTNPSQSVGADESGVSTTAPIGSGS